MGGGCTESKEKGRWWWWEIRAKVGKVRVRRRTRGRAQRQEERMKLNLKINIYIYYIEKKRYIGNGQCLKKRLTLAETGSRKRWKYLSVGNQRPGPNRLEILKQKRRRKNRVIGKKRKTARGDKLIHFACDRVGDEGGEGRREASRETGVMK